MFFKKDPVAELDYGYNWATWLNGDTISTSVFTVPTGLVKLSESNTATTSLVWVGGGVQGVEYELSVQVETVGGRTDRRVFFIHVTEHY